MYLPNDPEKLPLDENPFEIIHLESRRRRQQSQTQVGKREEINRQAEEFERIQSTFMHRC